LDKLRLGVIGCGDAALSFVTASYAQRLKKCKIQNSLLGI